MIVQETLTIRTRGRGAHEITGEVGRVVGATAVGNGLCHLFIRHTSASIILCENADPQVLRDLDAFLNRLVPDGDRLFDHDAEGPDDMPAHVRSVLTQSSLTVPVGGSRLLLGNWQGIFLYEHRRAPHHRQVIVTVHGEF